MDSQFMALAVVVFVNLRVWVIWEAILENFIQYIFLQMQIEDHTLKLVLHGSIYSKEWQFIFKRHVLPPWFHKKRLPSNRSNMTCKLYASVKQIPDIME